MGGKNNGNEFKANLPTINANISDVNVGIGGNLDAFLLEVGQELNELELA